VCLLAAWHDLPAEESGRERHYFALMLVLETFMVGVFAATDVFLFYVFFEAMLIPVYFLIGQFGGPRRQYAAIKFLLFSLAGGLIMLAAVIALYIQGPAAPTASSSEAHGVCPRLSRPQKWMFLGFFIAFAVKAPMWPVHTWLPGRRLPSPARHRDVARRCARQGRHLRDDPLLPRALPGASKWATPVVIVLAHRLDHLRRPPGHRPEGPHAPDRLHLDQPLRLHRLGHLRPHDDELGGRRAFTWSTTASPRRRSSSSPGCSCDATTAAR
jgi:NADH-quinone oxidoreductase subunit M